MGKDSGMGSQARLGRRDALYDPSAVFAGESGENTVTWKTHYGPERQPLLEHVTAVPSCRWKPEENLDSDLGKLVAMLFQA